MLFGLVTRSYLDQRLDDLRRDVERGRIDQSTVKEAIENAIRPIALEWVLWQKKLLTAAAALAKQNKKAQESIEDAPGEPIDQPEVPGAPAAETAPPERSWRSRRGF